MKIEKFFETASFHIVKPCNMKCKFCYATFEDQKVLKQLPIEDVFTILLKLKEAGLEKITFAGGEPMLYRYLDQSIIFAKEIGLTTSIITNGTFITEDWLNKMQGKLDWIGLSIDSLNFETNKNIGRIEKVKQPLLYLKLCRLIKFKRFKLKINTVVNKFNEDEDMNYFINKVNPARWKVFDTLRVEGQNDTQFEEIRSSKHGFTKFISRHYHPSLVPEDNHAMTGSYLLIDPQGRLFENSQGKHTYSDPLQSNDIQKCLGQINLNRKTFIERGGIYNW
jgi:radical S-adenosyl methionine domain-containing protein 2